MRPCKSLVEGERVVFRWFRGAIGFGTILSMGEDSVLVDNIKQFEIPLGHLIGVMDKDGEYSNLVHYE